MTQINLEMTDTIVQFYECRRLGCWVKLTDIYREGFTFEEFCELQAMLGRDSYRICEGNEHENMDI